jgi:hypothetical protein
MEETGAGSMALLRSYHEDWDKCTRSMLRGLSNDCKICSHKSVSAVVITCSQASINLFYPLYNLSSGVHFYGLASVI